MTGFTVFTPVYNGAATLDRLWRSLQAQTSHDFEWLVVDDGSDDRSAALVEAYQQRSAFAVRLVRHDANRGLAHAFRTSVAQAGGRLWTGLGQDDELLPGALERLGQIWSEAGADGRGRLAGVLGRSATNGVPLGGPLPLDPFDATMTHVQYVLRRRGETGGFVPIELLRRIQLPDVDRHVAHGVLWRALDCIRLTRFTDEVFRVYHRDRPESMTRTDRVRYPRGVAFVCALRLNVDAALRDVAPDVFAGFLTKYAVNARLAGLQLHEAVAHLYRPSDRLRLAWAWRSAGRRAAALLASGRVDPGRVTGDWDGRRQPPDMRALGLADPLAQPLVVPGGR